MKPFAIPTVLFVLLTTGAHAQVNSSPVELFEREIRPILVEKCQSCHGDSNSQGGLRLTSRNDILKGGGRGPAIVSSSPDQSLIIKAIKYRGNLKMPPAGKLPDSEIARFRRWIATGAVWTEGKPQTSVSTAHIAEAQRKWWSFQPLRSIAQTQLRDRSLPGSAIDRFIRDQQEKHHLAPSPGADKRTLIRRASFDLTGLPPTPEQVAAFLADKSPNAWANVIDRLLDSPTYGERSARHWLDVVRYADYHDGNPKARTASCEPLEAWRYRDWVVRAFNSDMPFDRFIIHQIAGDLLPIPEHQDVYADGLIATTFLTNGSWDRGDADKEKMVSDMVDDQIDTIGKAFLGLTLGCARCHDHKFDPVTQADYYGLAGIFYSTHILKDIGTKGGEYTLNRVPLCSKSTMLKREYQLKQLTELAAKLAELDKKTPKPPTDDAIRLALLTQHEKLQKELLPEPPLAEAAQEGGTIGGLFPKIQDVPLHIRGSYTRLGAVVPRHMPTFIAGVVQPTIKSGSGRKELADWIASKNNPLTARVIVNRVWQWHFGTGLVRTPNNFGMLSEPPSHPELLDWLATKFIEDGWSIKNLHRRIMLSAAYQRASWSKHNPSFESRVSFKSTVSQDPENRWLTRFQPRRLEAEAIRDAMLFVSGSLDFADGGPAAADMSKPCRSLYVQTARWDRGSFAILFDAANPDASVEKRDVSTVAPQALFLLNDQFVLAQAGKLAERVALEVPGDEVGRIQRAYGLLFVRAASAAEVVICRGLLAKAGWRELMHVLLCCDEFVYLD